MTKEPGALWLHSHGITISSEAHITIRPQTMAFRPRYLLIPEDAARGIALRGIVVGNHHQFTYDQAMVDKGIPASRFVTRADHGSLALLRRECGPHPIGFDLYRSLTRGAASMEFDAIAVAQDLRFIVEPYDPTTHTPRMFEAFLLGAIATTWGSL